MRVARSWARALGPGLAALGLACGFSAMVVVAALAGLAAKPGAPVVAVFAPRTGLGASLAAVGRAGGRVMGYGGRGWIVAVGGPDPGLQTALRREGAWVLLDIGKAAALCGVAGDALERLK